MIKTPPQGGLDINHLKINGHNFVHNADSGLRKWRAALAKVQSSGVGGTSALTIDLPIIHDSIGEGYSVWNTVTGHSDDFISYGWIGLLRSMFINKLGLDDVGRGIIHPGMVGKNAPGGGEPKWTFVGATWSRSYTYGPLGWAWNWSGTNAGQTATVSFNGTGVAILYAKRSFHSHFTYAIDGGAATDVDVYNATNVGMASTVVTGLSPGDHTLVITKGTDDYSLQICGIYEIKGSKGVRLHRIGVYGAIINNALLNADLIPYSEIDFWNPPLTIIAMIANDTGSQTALSSYKNDIQTLITRAKGFGDVMLVSYVPRDGVYAIPMTSYNNVLKGLAYENDCCFVDLLSKWKDYTTANSLGMMYDTVHPNAVGHQDIANAIWNVLVS